MECTKNQKTPSVTTWLISTSMAALGFSAQSANTDAASNYSTEVPAEDLKTFSKEYEPVRLDSRKGPDPDDFYPAGEAQAGHEGWTQISAMISPAGTPYELSVVDSTGNTALNNAALKLAQKMKFKAARSNGTTVDSGYSFKVIFNARRTGASKDFISAYNSLGQFVEIGNRAAAEELLKSMTIKNLYEDAYFGIAQFRFFSKWGNGEQQLQALNRAIAYEHEGKFLPRNLYESALKAIFNLKYNAKDFAGALQTYKDFTKEQRSDPEIIETLIAIKKLQFDKTTYTVRSQIPVNSTSRFFYLLKRHFSVLTMSGRMAELKLRCQKKYALIPYTTDIDYTIPDSYGECELELIGDSGSEFALIQS